MKKLITTIAAGLMVVSTPAAARDHNDNDTTGKVVAGVVGGLILGAIIAGDGKKDHRRYDRRYDRRHNGYGYGYDRDYYSYDMYEEDRYTMPRRPQYYENYCVTEQIVSRSGRIYFRRTCQ